MLKKTFVTSLALVFAGGASAYAADTTNNNINTAINNSNNPGSAAQNYGVEVDGKASSVGYGVEVGKMVDSDVGIRGGVNYINIDPTATNNGITYNTGINWLSADVFADYYPIQSSGFRLTGGAFVGDQNINMKATPSVNTQVGNNTYTPSEIGTLRADVKTDDVSPYVGFGYSSKNQNFDNWNVSIDAGVKYNGQSSTNLSSNGTDASNPTYQQDMAIEQHRLDGQLGFLNFYPVVALTVGYKF